MQSNLVPGTRVMTTTGLFATVSSIDEGDVILEIAPGVETRWLKASIGRVLTPEEETVDTGDAYTVDTGETYPVSDETPERRGDEGPTSTKS